MATRTLAHERLIREAHQWSWSGLLNGDDGAPADEKKGSIVFSDKTLHVLGTFGTGGTIVIEGSNDGSNWLTLTDPASNALSFTAASLQTILQNPRYIRPRVTAGDGTTDLQCIIVGRAVLQLR